MTHGQELNDIFFLAPQIILNSSHPRAKKGTSSRRKPARQSKKLITTIHNSLCCPQCSRVFHKSFALKRHVLKVHTTSVPIPSATETGPSVTRPRRICTRQGQTDCSELNVSNNEPQVGKPDRADTDKIGVDNDDFDQDDEIVCLDEVKACRNGPVPYKLRDCFVKVTDFIKCNMGSALELQHGVKIVSNLLQHQRGGSQRKDEEEVFIVVGNTQWLAPMLEKATTCATWPTVSELKRETD